MTADWLLELPALPERFGNPLLRGELHEIVPAAGIDWWPQTLGWYVAGGFALLLLLHRSWRVTRRWLRNRYRRDALRRLAAVDVGAPPGALNEILKLAAMTAASRREVAGLSGVSWGEWLQQRTPSPVLSPATLALLTMGPYSVAETDLDQDSAQVHTDIGNWLKYHRDDHEPA